MAESFGADECAVVSAAAMATPAPAAPASAASASSPAGAAVPQDIRVKRALEEAALATAARRHRTGAGRIGRGGNQYKQVFPLKLFHALESGAFVDAIDWTENGLSITIKDTTKLEERVLPALFKRECHCSACDELAPHARKSYISRAPLLACVPPQTPK